MQRALALTSSQVEAIEAEYSRTLNHRRLLRQELEAAHAEFTRALEHDDGSDAAMDGEPSRNSPAAAKRCTDAVAGCVVLPLPPEQRVAFPNLVRGDLLTIRLRC